MAKKSVQRNDESQFFEELVKSVAESDKRAVENRVRRYLSAHGYALAKSRARLQSDPTFGLYHIYDPETNTVIDGYGDNGFELTLHRAEMTARQIVSSRRKAAWLEAAEITAMIVVRRQWNDWRKASYRFADVDDFHWDNVSGGINAPANRYYVHAYVMCDQMLSGELAHTCQYGPAPHRIKVCITKVDNPKIFKLLEAFAGPNPNTRRAASAEPVKDLS